MNIPQSELDEMLELLKSFRRYLDTTYVTEKYREYGLSVIPDPFSHEIKEHIKYALVKGIPYSVIRIGDGEANLISLHAYPNTPTLNNYVFEKYIAVITDCFNLDPLWKIIIHDMLMGAIAQANIIGVRGIWRATPPNPDIMEHYQNFLKEYRGGSGVWTAIDYLLKMAQKGLLDHKIIASAHLYFSVIEYIHELMLCTKQVYIISSREQIARKLARKYPEINVEFIPVGKTLSTSINNKPEFLLEVCSKLPSDMSGSLSLLGAGPWAKIYCSWIKQRGGVAVDIGSGFDLLDGEISRPIHTSLGLDKYNKYAL